MKQKNRLMHLCEALVPLLTTVQCVLLACTIGKLPRYLKYFHVETRDEVFRVDEEEVDHSPIAGRRRTCRKL
jgi:hypothetical protein